MTTESPYATRALRPRPRAAPRSHSSYVRLAKPVIDRSVAAVVLLASLPVLLLAMLAVRCSMGPGVLFSQTRVGLDGATFRVYKLRTMRHCRRTSPDDVQAFLDGRWDGVERRRTHKSDEDPRHTTVGRILRMLSIDELPQLVNVLAGQMSLVGPRPELPVVVERHYEPWMHRRHNVKPGLTGQWQVSARGEGEMYERVDLDLEYVDRVGLATDLKILLRTPFAALGPHRGS